MTWRSTLAAAGAAVATLCACAQSASAITIDSLSTQPSGTQAASHPNFTLSMTFGGGSTPKAMRIDLPPGFVGNPGAVAKCAQAVFEAGNCGSDSVVGSTSVHTAAGLPGTGGPGGGGGGGLPLPEIPPILPPDSPACALPLPILCTSGLGLGGLGLGGLTQRSASARATARQLPTLELPLTVPGVVYNLEPNPNEPARLGIEILESIRIQSVVDLRDGSDFGLTSLLDNLPNSFLGAPNRITGMDLTLLGTTANGNSFVTLPTTCVPATTTVNVTPYNGDSATASASFTPTGCADVPLTPQMNVVPSTTRIDSNAAYAITLAVPAEERPIRQSHVAEVRVSLPENVGLNPGSAQGLEACPDDAFGRGQRRAPTCQDASKIGTVSFTSPLVGTLEGTVYEGEPKPDQMIRLFVDVPGPGFRIKLVGDVNTDPRTGQVHSVFRGLPQLPFTFFTLRFRGGDKSILTSPSSCGQARSTATLVPYSGNAPATATTAFDATLDDGAPCTGELPFNPSVAVQVDPSTAGAGTAMTQVVSREERTQRLKDMELSFPAGLVGGLGGGIGLCEVGKARDGQCPANSRVGSAGLVAGPGPQPLNINGDVFLVAPFREGTLAALAITVPGKVGPFDLGTTVSFAHISVRKADSGLEVVANDLPQIVGGIPLNLRRVRLVLDRKGFMRNATTCAEQAMNATFTAVGGAKATASAPYRATDCDKVPFEPKLEGVVGKPGEIAKGDHPGVTALVTQKDGEIASKEVQVTLPPQVAVDVTRIAVACPEGQDCGERNTIGSATAVTPLLPIPLTGPVKLIAPKGGGVPELRLELSGLLSISLTGKTALTGAGVRNTFSGIPDVPLSRFELKLKGGKEGILVATENLTCGQKLKGTGLFTGHSGAQHRASGTFEVCGEIRSAASKRKKTRMKAKAVFKKGVLKVTVTGSKKLKKAKLTLPRPATLHGRKGVKVKGGAKARVGKVGKHSIAVSKLGRRKVVLTMGKATLRGGKKADKADKKVAVKATVGKQRMTKRVKIR
jgi:hypothetical protein